MDFVKLIEIWKALLQEECLEGLIAQEASLRNLHLLWILHQANERHGGGDAQGVVYARLWQLLLKPLQKRLKQHHVAIV